VGDARRCVLLRLLLLLLRRRLRVMLTAAESLVWLPLLSLTKRFLCNIKGDREQEKDKLSVIRLWTSANGQMYVSERCLITSWLSIMTRPSLPSEKLVTIWVAATGSWQHRRTYNIGGLRGRTRLPELHVFSTHYVFSVLCGLFIHYN